MIAVYNNTTTKGDFDTNTYYGDVIQKKSKKDGGYKKKINIKLSMYIFLSLKTFVYSHICPYLKKWDKCEKLLYKIITDKKVFFQK